MSIITTKQLRENMPHVISELRLGKPIQLSYRHRIIGTLQPINVPAKALRRGSPEAIRQGIQGLSGIVVPDSVKQDTRSVKEQIAEIRYEKYNR